MEFALCLLFPLLLWLANGRLWRGFALIAAGLAGLMALRSDLRRAWAWTSPITMACCAGLSDFSIGVGLAVLFRGSKPRDRLPDWVHSLIQTRGCSALLVYAIYDTGWSHTRDGHLHRAADDGAGACAGLRPRLGGATRCKTRLPQMLGEWSYAIYMGQTFWLLVIRFFEQRLYPPPDDARAGHDAFPA